MQTHREHGSNQLTITPEFDPYPYMQHLPYTNQPIADQWDINRYMLNTLRTRYTQNGEGT